jgi:hypothetical protein
MEVADRAHGGGAQAKTRGGPRHTAAGKVVGRPRKDAVAGETPAERRRRLDREAKAKKREAAAAAAEQKHATYSKAIKGYWANMTAEERSKEMKRRAKVALAKGGKPFSSMLPGAKKKRDEARQNRYLERSKLRKQGVPEDQLPPVLPKAPAA